MNALLLSVLFLLLVLSIFIFLITSFLLHDCPIWSGAAAISRYLCIQASHIDHLTKTRQVRRNSWDMVLRDLSDVGDQLKEDFLQEPSGFSLTGQPLSANTSRNGDTKKDKYKRRLRQRRNLSCGRTDGSITKLCYWAQTGPDKTQLLI